MQRTRWLLPAVLLALMLLATPLSAAVQVQLNGTPVTFDVPPVNEDGRTLVPMRAIFEALGASIEWDAATQTVKGYRPGRNVTLKLTLGAEHAEVNGRQVALDTPAKMIDGRTMVPLRFVAETLGGQITYDPGTETISITTSTEPAGAAKAGLTAQEALELNAYIKRVVYDCDFPASSFCYRNIGDSPGTISGNDYTAGKEFAETAGQCFQNLLAKTAELNPPAVAQAVQNLLVQNAETHQRAYVALAGTYQAAAKGDGERATTLFTLGLDLRNRVEQQLGALSEQPVPDGALLLTLGRAALVPRPADQRLPGDRPLLERPADRRRMGEQGLRRWPGLLEGGGGVHCHVGSQHRQRCAQPANPGNRSEDAGDLRPQCQRLQDHGPCFPVGPRR